MKSPRMQIRVMSDMDTESVPKYPADTEAGCVGRGQQHRLHRSGWEADKGEDQTQTPTPASPDPERVLGAAVDSRADKLILALA